MLDLRRVKRQRMIKSLSIVSDNGTISCVVLNISSRGVLAHLPKPSSLPEVVILKLPDGTERSARKCWGRSTDVGFEFLTLPRVEPYL